MSGALLTCQRISFSEITDVCLYTSHIPIHRTPKKAQMMSDAYIDSETFIYHYLDGHRRNVSNNYYFPLSLLRITVIEAHFSSLFVYYRQ